jgi:hypothetical protein
MFGEFVPEAVAGILAAPVGVVDERALGLFLIQMSLLHVSASKLALRK